MYFVVENYFTIISIMFMVRIKNKEFIIFWIKI